MEVRGPREMEDASALFCTREREGERWEAEKRERKGGVGAAKGDGREKRVTVREKEKEI